MIEERPASKPNALTLAGRDAHEAHAKPWVRVLPADSQASIYAGKPQRYSAPCSDSVKRNLTGQSRSGGMQPLMKINISEMFVMKEWRKLSASLRSTSKLATSTCRNDRLPGHPEEQTQRFSLTWNVVLAALVASDDHLTARLPWRRQRGCRDHGHRPPGAFDHRHRRSPGRP